jgi:hypothetical protein
MRRQKHTGLRSRLRSLHYGIFSWNTVAATVQRLPSGVCPCDRFPSDRSPFSDWFPSGRPPYDTKHSSGRSPCRGMLEWETVYLDYKRPTLPSARHLDLRKYGSRATGREYCLSLTYAKAKSTATRMLILQHERDQTGSLAALCQTVRNEPEAMRMREQPV